MVAEIALAQETPWRGGWWDLGKQKVGTAVTADPFLQGVLSQRMCYSLWTIWGLLQLWLYMVVNVTCRKSKGVWIERCWLSSAALLFTCRHNLGPWYSQTLSVLLETVLKATVKLKGATTVNLQHYLGHTSVNFLLFPFPFLLCQPMLVGGGRGRFSAWYSRSLLSLPKGTIPSWLSRHSFRNLGFLRLGWQHGNPRFCPQVDRDTVRCPSL